MGFFRTLAALAAIGSVPGAAAKSSRLDVVNLPVGFMPEGIALAEAWTVYVGSLQDGAIWKGDLSTGEGEVVLSEGGGIAVGLNYDRRSGYLYVCGGFAGTARVYDTKTADFDLVANVTFVGSDGGLVNDVIVTDAAAFFSDSLLAQIYSVPLDRDSGRLKHVKEAAAVASETIPLSGFPIAENTADGNGFAVNGNGIEETEDGTLIVAHMSRGELYAVDPATGEVSNIDLGGVPVHGDGMVLRKNTLWVVENTVAGGDNQQITEVSLSANLTCGTVVRALRNDLFDQPSTAVRKGNSLYAIIAKFGTPDEELPTTPYEIVRLDRDGDAEDVCPASV